MYLPLPGLISLGSNGQEIIGLSELKQLCPGKYDDLTLDYESCIMVANNAGADYARKVGGIYHTKNGMNFTIVDTITEEETFASVVVNDGILGNILHSIIASKINLYCYDKDAMISLLAQPLPESLNGILQLQVTDHYGHSMTAYEAAAKIRADARTIVTLTVIFLSLVMLYLMRRSQLQKRIGMMAVYRLLGIPAGELISIFCAEALTVSLLSALPAAILLWLAVKIAGQLPSLNFHMILGLGDSAMIFLFVLFCNIQRIILASIINNKYF